MNIKLQALLVNIPLFTIIYTGVSLLFPEGLMWESALSPSQGWLLGVILMTFITILHKEPTK